MQGRQRNGEPRRYSPDIRRLAGALSGRPTEGLCFGLVTSFVSSGFRQAFDEGLGWRSPIQPRQISS